MIRWASCAGHPVRDTPAYIDAMTARSTCAVQMLWFFSRGYVARGSAARPQGGPSLRVFRHADQTPQHPAFEGLRVAK